MGAKQRETNAATAAAIQTEHELLLAPGRRNRVDSEFASAQEELARAQAKLQRSQNKERESRQLANEAKKRETAANKAIDVISAQEKADEEERVRKKVAFKAAERLANEERIVTATATDAATTTAQTTAGENLAVQLKMQHCRYTAHIQLAGLEANAAATIESTSLAVAAAENKAKMRCTRSS